MIAGTSGLGTADPPLVLSRLSSKNLLPLCVVKWGLRVVCPVRGETKVVPFLTDKQMHKTLTHTLAQTSCMLQNNTFVFILRFFFGFALPARGLFSWAGCGSGCCCHSSAGCCSACCCTSSVCLVPLGGLLLALLHKQDRRAKE